jgi:site-specific DNA-methyltransferase (adenine-specific)
MKLNTIYEGDALEVLRTLPDSRVDCCVTSPPYWGLRDYRVAGQLGQEDTPEIYITRLLEVFREVQRILKPSGTCFVNLGDTYAGGGAGTAKNANISAYLKKSKQSYILPNGAAKSAIFRGTNRNKSLLMIPYQFAQQMIDVGWVLRNIIIWHKPNQMPANVKDRFTVDFEPIFFFVKKQKYYFCQQLEPYTKPLNRWDGDNLVARGKSTWADSTGQKAYRDRNMRPNPKGRNMRTVWAINTKPSGGIVLDPFAGAGTTAIVARRLGQNYVGIELNPEYVKLANERLEACV